MILLLPCSIIAGRYTSGTDSEPYTISTVLSFGLLVSSVSNVLHCERFPAKPLSYIVTAAVVAQLLTLYTDLGRYLLYSQGRPEGGLKFLLNDLIYSFKTFFRTTGIGYNVACAMFCAFSYHHILHSVVSCCPLSFTYGEATVTAQAALLFAVASITNMLAPFHLQTCFGVFTLILQVQNFEVYFAFIAEEDRRYLST